MALATGDAARWEVETGDCQPILEELGIPLSEVTFCVIDLETTGTDSNSRITEIGAVKSRGGEVLGSFQTLVNPGVPIPAHIAELNGFTDATVADAPRLSEVFASLIEFCRGSVMVAHNARFDMGFLNRAAIGLGYEWPPGVVIDTVALARRIIPRHEVANYRLGTLAAYVSTTVTPNHRALDDALATLDLLHALLGRVGNQSVKTLEDLQEFSYAVSPSRRAKHPWAKKLPEGPGVYYFFRESGEKRQILYVGTSRSIRRRVATYFTASEQRRRMEEMVNLASGVEALSCRTSLEAAIVELRLISAHQPPYNRRSKQPHHLWIKLTDEPLPRLSIVRRVVGSPAGYCAVKPDGGTESIFISKLYVVKELRKQGIAKKLLETSVADIKDGRYRSLWLTVNKGNAGSISAYEKMGFAVNHYTPMKITLKQNEET